MKHKFEITGESFEIGRLYYPRREWCPVMNWAIHDINYDVGELVVKRNLYDDMPSPTLDDKPSRITFLVFLVDIFEREGKKHCNWRLVQHYDPISSSTKMDHRVGLTGMDFMMLESFLENLHKHTVVL